jgi:hypothetical protein
VHSPRRGASPGRRLAALIHSGDAYEESAPRSLPRLCPSRSCGRKGVPVLRCQSSRVFRRRACAPKPPPARLTRAELYAFGTVGALAVAACGSEVILVNANDAGTDAEGLDRDAYTIEPPYGGVPACGPNTYPCPDGGSVDGNEASSEASSNDAVCNACVPYGLPGFGGPPERD